MKHYAIFDIRLCQPRASSGRRGPDPSLYGTDPAVLRVSSGILPMAGASPCSHGLLMR